MKLYNEEQRELLNEMNYQQRKQKRTEKYFSEQFGWSEYESLDKDGNKVKSKIKGYKADYFLYVKFLISGTPSHLQTKPVKLSDPMI